jgi:hypothetical protein
MNKKKRRIEKKSEQACFHTCADIALARRIHNITVIIGRAGRNDPIASRPNKK